MDKKNNKKISLVIAGILVLATIFYGGMIYGESKTPAKSRGSLAFSQNNIGGRRGGGLGGLTMGEIISKDDKSITVKLTAGGSKIVFFGTNMAVTKTVPGSAGDLTVGAQVSVNGDTNPDGSITAQSVQIRPANTAK